MTTTAMINVYFVKMSTTDGSPPQHFFIFNPVTVQTLTPTPAGTSYSVTFNLFSNVTGATIKKEDTVSGAPPDLVAIGDGSTVLTLTFTNSHVAGQAIHFNYELTVQVGTQTFTSLDPEIEVPPPT